MKERDISESVSVSVDYYVDIYVDMLICLNNGKVKLKKQETAKNEIAK